VRLLSLELRDFRNHRNARAELDGEPSLLLGENGSGKTNWIEAAVLLSIGRSFRGARDRELVGRGAERFEVRGVVVSRAGVRSEIVARGSRNGPREVDVDGAALPRLAELLGRFPTAHFSVEDVATLNGAPAGRRRFLDVALCQVEPVYVGHLRDYNAALKQRNRLLVGFGPGGASAEDELGAWETILARSGAELDRRREDLTAELNRILGRLSRDLDSELEAGIEYTTTVPETGEAGVAKRAERLERDRGRDRRLGWTAEGPHRAPVACRVAGRDLVEGASRGMTRLYSILLRLALARVLDARLEEPPVVFLDDPESELDPRWIGRLLGIVPESSQVVLTACRALTATPATYRRFAMESLASAASGEGATTATAARTEA
jgi:DNA replication and repair protein RecF